MECITLNSGYALACSGTGGAKKAWLANHKSNNSYVKNTGDSTGTYSVVASGGSGLILITGDNGSGSHGLEPGLIVTLTGGDYNGTYSVQTTPTTTTFTVKATFVATDTGAYSYESNAIIGTSNANGEALTFYNIEQEIETIQVTCSGTGSIETGTFVEEQTISLTLPASKNQASEDARRTLIDKIVRGRFVVVVQDNNGVKRVYGAVNGLKLPEGKNSAGKALSSLSGFTFTLKGVETEQSFIYDDAGDTSGSPAEAYTAFTFV